MDVYLLAPITDHGSGRQIQPFPANIRLNARGIAGGAYSWDSTGARRPEFGQLMYVAEMIYDFGFCGIGRYGVPEEHWNNAMSIMVQSPMEIPQGRNVDECVASIRTTGVALRNFAQNTLSVSLSADGDTLMSQVLTRLTNWSAAGPIPTAVRAFYLGHFQQTITTYPTLLWSVGADGFPVPNVANATTYLNGYDALAHTAPIKLADWLHLAAQCHRAIKRLA